MVLELIQAEGPNRERSLPMVAQELLCYAARAAQGDDNDQKWAFLATGSGASTLE